MFETVTPRNQFHVRHPMGWAEPVLNSRAEAQRRDIEASLRACLVALAFVLALYLFSFVWAVFGFWATIAIIGLGVVAVINLRRALMS